MSDVRRLLEQVAPMPWHYFSDGTIFGNDGDGIAECYGNAAHLVDPSHRAEVIVHAVNRLPDYEVAVNALERLLPNADDALIYALQPEMEPIPNLRDLRAAIDEARAALAPLRPKPEESPA